ncbi:MAG TPA: 2-oxoacid:acceptor oxidoreductase family protein [Solirubrobacteraceae bacterium]|nr:2-oxoacid:acceptor oxidoreductase family protein [Solirubrobacteraceae bacterium]
MFQARIHGRGGQGVVTAAELLSLAAFAEGRHAQAFPSFGSERTGAPVVSFCRIDEHPIRTREPVAHPDALIVQDATLLHQVDVFGGLAPEGYVLINSVHTLEELGLGEWAMTFRRDRLLSVPAADIARRATGAPRANAALLGGLAALTGVVSLDSVRAAIEQRFPGRLGSGNAAAAAECFAVVARRLGREPVTAEREEPAHA